MLKSEHHSLISFIDQSRSKNKIKQLKRTSQTNHAWAFSKFPVLSITFLSISFLFFYNIKYKFIFIFLLASYHVNICGCVRMPRATGMQINDCSFSLCRKCLDSFLLFIFSRKAIVDVGIIIIIIIILLLLLLLLLLLYNRYLKNKKVETHWSGIFTLVILTGGYHKKYISR